jgi:hypothetical protein
MADDEAAFELRSPDGVYQLKVWENGSSLYTVSGTPYGLAAVNGMSCIVNRIPRIGDAAYARGYEAGIEEGLRRAREGAKPPEGRYSEDTVLVRDGVAWWFRPRVGTIKRVEVA